MSDKFLALILGVVIGSILWVSMVVGPLSTKLNTLEREAQQRGLMIYCPSDGRLDWKDKCDGTR